MNHAEIIAARKQRWVDFYDPAKPPTRMFWIHEFSQLGERPWPYPDRIPERIEWSWQKYQIQCAQLDWLDDDSLPFLDIFTGTEIFAESFGCPVHNSGWEMPFATPRVFNAEEAAAIEIPPIDAPPLARAWEIARELRRRAGPEALVRLPDIQSPMDIAALIQFFFLANIFFSPIQILGNQYNQALTAMAGAERVFGLLDTPPAWTDAPDATPIEQITGRVEFDAVTFGYDPDRPVLHDISFVAEPGQTVALVGHTGSGKTSIINLVSKFYLPQQGEIRIDGHPLSRITTDSLHDRLGIVLQHNFLFTGSVLDNIRYGNPRLSEDEVRNVLARLDCLDLIAALPQGLHTEVGEKGSGLSLGQKQLVCFARALAADPAILILDEATSAVDTLTEQRLQAALETLLAGRTSFVVAHRLSTIEKADLVLVLDQGHIIERGNHAELLTQNGTYAHLVEQFRGQ